MKINFRSFFISMIIFISLVNYCSADPNNLETRVIILEHRVDDSLMSIKEVSQAAIDACKRQTDYLSLGLAIAGILITGTGFVIAKQVRRFHRIDSTLEALSNKVKNEMLATTYLNRAILSLSHCDSVSDETVKIDAARNALEYIEAAEDTGYSSSILFNWKGYALKRMGRYEEALSAAKKAYALSSEDSYEKARAAYNAACYSALLSRKHDAKKFLEEAIKLKPHLRTVARNDPDLGSIINQLNNLLRDDQS